jgi:alpha-tubulin suppressor-like RCC1 family protein
LLFWGNNRESQVGSGTGDPSLVDTIYFSPVALSQDSVLGNLLANAPAEDDNVTLGVAQGSAADDGTFQILTGHRYGSQALLRDGSVYGWGNGVWGGSGTSTANDAAGKTPTKLSLPDPDNPGQDVKVMHIAQSERIVFLLDVTGTVWMYGRTGGGEGAILPKADGTPRGPKSPPEVIAPPMRINGDAVPEGEGWHAGGITGIASAAAMTVMLTRDDGTAWIAGGSTMENKKNEYYLVRSSWDSVAGFPSAAHQPLTKIDLAGLPD